MDVGALAKACADLTQSLRSLRLPGGGNGNQEASTSAGASAAAVPPPASPVAALRLRLFSFGGQQQAPQPPAKQQSPKRTTRRRHPRRQAVDDGPSERTPAAPGPAELAGSGWLAERLAGHCSPYEAARLCRVCPAWRDALYRADFWRRLRLVLPLRLVPPDAVESDAAWSESLDRLFASVGVRGIDSFGFSGLTDAHLPGLLPRLARLAGRLTDLAIADSPLSDSGLAALLAAGGSPAALSLTGCNRLAEPAAAACRLLPGSLVSLSVSDCAGLTDQSVATLATRLPRLRRLELQSCHLTDACLPCLADCQAGLASLDLPSCWELTDRGAVALSAALPGLRRLCLSGCSKLTDEAVDALADGLRQLRELDLSWCARLTDVALECIACDMSQLEALWLDRCPAISDIGIGYLSTMPKLRLLSLRWCTGLSDTAVRHAAGMRDIVHLSLSGVTKVTGDGLCHLIRARRLRTLELTNCPAASRAIRNFLQLQLPGCRIYY